MRLDAEPDCYRAPRRCIQAGVRGVPEVPDQVLCGCTIDRAVVVSLRGGRPAVEPIVLKLQFRFFREARQFPLLLGVQGLRALRVGSSSRSSCNFSWTGGGAIGLRRGAVIVPSPVRW